MIGLEKERKMADLTAEEQPLERQAVLNPPPPSFPNAPCRQSRAHNARQHAMDRKPDPPGYVARRQCVPATGRGS